MGNEGFIISVFSSDMEADQCTAGLFIVLPLDQLTCMILYVLAGDPALQLAVGLLMLKSELASHSEQNMSLDSEHTLDLASEIFLTFLLRNRKKKRWCCWNMRRAYRFKVGRIKIMISG